MSGDADCLFCKIVRGEIPAAKVFENEHALAFNDISPQAPTHLLVIPKQHIPMLAETADSQVLGHVLDTARQVAREKGLNDYRVVINNGAEAGQSVFHLHLHVLGGRAFTWPPG